MSGLRFGFFVGVGTIAVENSMGDKTLRTLPLSHARAHITGALDYIRAFNAWPFNRIYFSQVILFGSCLHGRRKLVGDIDFAVAFAGKDGVDNNDAFDNWYFAAEEGDIDQAKESIRRLISPRFSIHDCHEVLHRMECPYKILLEVTL